MTDSANPRDDATEQSSGRPHIAALLPLLIASLEALASAGQVDEACRLAGQACAHLRHTDPRGWNRVNALLHRLARRAPPVGVSHVGSHPAGH